MQEGLQTCGPRTKISFPLLLDDQDGESVKDNKLYH